jgi:RNA polymerase sigma-70 factor (ECF subfamily)
MSARVPAPTFSIVSVTPPFEDELELVASLRNGSLEALAHSYDQWNQRIRVLARRLLLDDATAEDVVQEVFAALPAAIRRYRGETPLETFLLVIAVRRSRDHQRAALRHRRALEQLGTRESLYVRDVPDPERDAYRKQLGQRLVQALQHLSHVQRVAFVLCEVEGLTSSQAAAIARIPEATVRTRLFHARRQLRNLLSREHRE